MDSVCAVPNRTQEGLLPLTAAELHTAIALDILLYFIGRVMGLFVDTIRCIMSESMGLFWTHYSETGAFLGYKIHVQGPTRQPIRNELPSTWQVSRGGVRMKKALVPSPAHFRA